MDQEIIKIRQVLHQNPELSNKEFQTSNTIAKFMNNLNPDETINISETGKLFIYDSKKEGKTVVFRAEMDALPII